MKISDLVSVIFERGKEFAIHFGNGEWQRKIPELSNLKYSNAVFEINLDLTNVKMTKVD